jgi:hypothetical protein
MNLLNMYSNSKYKYIYIYVCIYIWISGVCAEYLVHVDWMTWRATEVVVPMSTWLELLGTWKRWAESPNAPRNHRSIGPRKGIYIGFTVPHIWDILGPYKGGVEHWDGFLYAFICMQETSNLAWISSQSISNIFNTMTLNWCQTKG